MRDAKGGEVAKNGLAARAVRPNSDKRLPLPHDCPFQRHGRSPPGGRLCPAGTSQRDVSVVYYNNGVKFELSVYLASWERPISFNFIREAAPLSSYREIT